MDLAAEEIIKRSGLYFARPDGSVWSRYFGEKPLRLSNTHGYLKFNAYVGGKQYHSVKAHRFVWWYLCGSIPKGMHVNHKDFNKRNNNLSNLEIVTPLGNSQHAKAGGRTKKPEGHGRGIKNGRAKLSEDQVREIEFRAVALETPVKSLCVEFGVGMTMVYDIKHHRKWGHLWGK